MNTTLSAINNVNDTMQDEQVMSIIERTDIPSLHQVSMQDSQHNLGIVKDFRKHPLLAGFLPEAPERISFSWVRLLAGESLSVHFHPTPSLILICQGEGYCTGDVTGVLKEGAAVVVPPNCLHGFVGAGEQGFWGLSIQLEGLGLYEDVSSPRVLFSGASRNADAMSLLLNAHRFFMEDFKRNPFFSLLNSTDIESPQVLEGFLDQIQYFSTHFQKLLKTRLSTAVSPLERELAIEHLKDEAGHDEQFAAARGNPTLTNINETIILMADWFEEQMRFAPETEKLILMHFVLEGSGQLAHAAVLPTVKSMPVEHHFAVHEEDDEAHFQMGVDALSTVENLPVERLLTVLATGWVKLNQMCAGMAEGALRRKTHETN